MGKIQIPWKKLREAEIRVTEFDEPRQCSVIFQNALSGKKLKVGGVWDNIKNRYLADHEIEGMGEDHKRVLERRRPRVQKLSPPQWRYMLHGLEGCMNDYRLSVDPDEMPVQIALLHGARRAGKSVALFSVVLLVTLAQPGATIYVVGLRKKHVRKIINQMMRALHRSVWTYDAYNDILRLCNGSVIESKSHINYDSDVGDELDLLALDEAAIMRERVFNKLFPSCSNRNGFCAMASSPREFNWFYEKAEYSESENDKQADSVRVVALRPEDNIFAPIVSRRAEDARYMMGEDEWRQEMMGEFLQKSGKVLPGFDKHLSVMPETVMTGDSPQKELPQMWLKNPSFGYIVSVDYNVNPTVGALMKVDEFGRIWIIDEIYTDQTTDAWGEMLAERLQQKHGVTDPHRECIIVGDASGFMQDPRDKKNSKSAQILMQQGWKVVRPCKLSRRNPSRVDRMQVMRALVLNAAGERRLFVDPRCEMIIKALRTLPLIDKGHHDTRHDMAHYYDAASYAPYRIWGDTVGSKTIGQRVFKKQLVRNKNYEEVDQAHSRLDTRSKIR